MLNFHNDRRKSCVDFKCESYVIIGKINNKFMVMAINDKNTCITDIKDNLCVV